MYFIFVKCAKMLIVSSGNQEYLVPKKAIVIQIALRPLMELWFETGMRELQTYERKHL